MSRINKKYTKDYKEEAEKRFTFIYECGCDDTQNYSISYMCRMLCVTRQGYDKRLR
ncbi:MAG: hypothetical protein LBN22_08130 [Clostridiales Family XIII bacterium]|nr:hypothetical protein [Clostridiales Family XIII bacterium]